MAYFENHDKQPQRPTDIDLGYRSTFMNCALLCVILLNKTVDVLLLINLPHALAQLSPALGYVEPHDINFSKHRWHICSEGR